MPIYEYRCVKCGQVTEFFVHKVGGSPDRLVCEHCGGQRLERTLSNVAVQAGTSTRQRPGDGCSLPRG